MIELACHLVLVICGGYLGLRLLGVGLRVRWARRAYPRVTPADQAPQGDHRDRCRGLLVGGAIGDALGLPAEQLPSWLVRLRYGAEPRMRRGIFRPVRQAGDVSDDTQLTICVARSIDPSGRYLHARFRDELAVWRGYRVAPGRACSQAARRAHRAALGGHEGAAGVASEGNGAAIRVAPLCIAHAEQSDLTTLETDVALNARETHGAERAVDAALLMARLLHAALTRPARSLTGAALETLIDEQVSQSGLVEPELLRPRAGEPAAQQLRRIGTSGHVLQSVPAALALVRRCGLDLPAAMRAAIAAGGDTDSTCAMAASLIGAQLGLSDLPRDWVAAVQHRDYLLHQADRLASPGPPTEGAGEVVEVEGDVALREVDAVVNAWNRNVIPAWLLLPQGVSKAIRKAGGRPAIRRVSSRAPLPLGSATETRGYDLAARWVIHVAGINMLWRGSARTTRLSTDNALCLARCLGARTVALPLIGAGSGGAATERTREVMRERLAVHAEHFDRLELVSYTG